jgi:hypothetical protein
MGDLYDQYRLLEGCPDGTKTGKDRTGYGCRRRNGGMEEREHNVAWFTMPDLGTGTEHVTYK